MYSKEFMKFLYNYQREDFKPKENTPKQIHFKSGGSGKLADVTIMVNNNK